MQSIFITARCRHGAIASFFGESPPDCDQHCDYCKNPKLTEKERNEFHSVSFSSCVLVGLRSLVRSIFENLAFILLPSPTQTRDFTHKSMYDECRKPRVASNSCPYELLFSMLFVVGRILLLFFIFVLIRVVSKKVNNTLSHVH